MKKLLHKGLVLAVLSFLAFNNIQASVSVLNGLTHEREASQGKTYDGIIQLKNTGQEPETVRLYQRDFRFTYKGDKFYEKPGQLQRSNTSWITFGPQRISISPQETIEVKFTVKVPNDDEMTGTYWSIIMVEGEPRLSAMATSPLKKDINFGINQVMRYAVQIVTHIEKSGIRNIKFLNTELIHNNDKRVLQIDVENTGERWLRPTMYLDLYDEQGNHLGKHVGGSWRIYPCTSVRYRVDLTNIPEGKYLALVVIDNNDDYVFGAQYTLDFTSTTKDK